MIYAKLHGRIGNHLFEMATAATLAARNNDKFCAVCHTDYMIAPPDSCSIWEFVQPYLNNIYSKVSILENIPVGLPVFKQEGYQYKEIPYQPNLLLDGGFQSYKYFDEEIVKQLFAIPDIMKKEINSKYGIIFSEPIVGVNVRRGDYCFIPHRLPVCSKVFFQKAMKLFPKGTRFLFISDDINWCKKHFKGNNIFYLENSTPLIDLYAQTLCTDNIISNSTFSWWGAYLNPHKEKKVICPKPWFGPCAKNSKSDVDDLIPDNWIQITNHLEFKLWFKSLKLSVLTKLGVIK